MLAKTKYKIFNKITEKKTIKVLKKTNTSVIRK